ncbi:hypothetical protein [Fuerstiella marisgermanici]|uniref:Branched-chain alpha-keto acid dehydrogenase subunit E2 n=1 Tax=Fuerstiella marisgermanici TaxID=1891926 RepID=A0A1P8WET8_9PLAN|nr:hypothetical protein [Fuerstiella marisgermanici]APZ92537.1 branched-chain alpha-keto acid dehydrogenase subunit E2 [Fuerstiella marisgermanici]
MQKDRNGRIFGIPRSRRLSWDLLYFNRAVPQCGHDRRIDLSALSAARSAAAVRISWPALFLKAYALLAKDVPELRQTWYRWPFAHMYQHPSSVGVLTVQREHKGEPWLFWGRIPRPEELSLVEIQAHIDEMVTKPVSRRFRRELRLAQLPTLMRRFIWGWNIHVVKAARAERLGTFFLSTLSGQGAEIQIPPSVHTGCLTYGPLNENGITRVTLAYDHRVMDGSLVARCLAGLESIFLQTLCDEVLNSKLPAGNIAAAA